ncbi:hypothetical protein [Devosia sp.]|uniref:hypothetical protein n=1 Tax=Devosia sp. TaxID=1871048 RepID=UPI0032669D8E
MATDPRVAALSQSKQAATYAGLKKLGKALSDAKYNAQPRGGNVRFVENKTKMPDYKQRVTYRTEIVKTAMPVYEDRPVVATIVNGTKPIKPHSDLATAQIDDGANFTVQVGDGDPAEITFTGNRVSLKIGAAITAFDYTPGAGALADKLTKALNTIPGMQASLDTEGKLKLKTDDLASLSIDDAADGTPSPLDALGITPGDYEAGPTTEKVQVGTQLVPTGTKQVEIGRDYERIADKEIVSGVTAVRDKPSESDAVLTAASRKQIIDATLALDAAVGQKELVKGVENPFFGLRTRIGLGKLKTATTRGDLGLSGLQIAVALKAYAKASAGGSK